MYLDGICFLKIMNLNSFFQITPSDLSEKLSSKMQLS